MTSFNPHAPITIRFAASDDELALVRLAALDSAPALPGRVLIAEVEGEIRAAVSLLDGASIADPFHPTLHLLELLRAHAAGETGHRSRSRRSSALRIALGV